MFPLLTASTTGSLPEKPETRMSKSRPFAHFQLGSSSQRHSPQLHIGQLILTATLATSASRDIRVCQPPRPQPVLAGGLPNDPAIVKVNEVDIELFFTSFGE
jgi:hypothetical protein